MDGNLKQKLSKLPVAPGVYFHKNAKGEVIYVGKAAVLKNRVRQYFQKSRKDAKTEALVSEISDVDWITVDTEMDALFLESEMIKRYMPKWNILLRDDKTVSFVRIDMKSEVPYVSFTRTPVDDGARYIGPFYGKSAVEKAVRILRPVFPYYVKPYTGKRSLDTDLKLTPGLEVGASSAADYKQNLRKLIRYLEGDREKLLKDLEGTMKEASERGDFETAAEARDQLFGLRELKRKIVFSDKEFLDISSDQALKELQDLLGLEKPPRRIEGYDISHQSGTNTVGSMVVFINGVAARSEYRKFKIRSSTNDDLKSMREVLTRRMKHKEWEMPDLIILDGGKSQVEAVSEIVSNIPVIGRNKSGDHSRNAVVKLVVQDSSKLGARPASSSPRVAGASPRLASLRTPFASDYLEPYRSIRNAPELNYLELPPTSHIARLIARIDEEAHRFAVTYHSLLKRKSMLK